jgi:alpha-tubulin suppressor-like RCC1 family protein
VTFKTHIGLAYGSGLHLLAFSDSGELYTWGYNTYSQLGNGNTNHTLTPSLVSGVLAGKTVIQVNIYSITKFVLLLIINPF